MKQAKDEISRSLTYNYIHKLVYKLRLQDEVGRWSKTAHFLSTFIP